MGPGPADVRVPKWLFVYNHLHTVHAIAYCKAAEVARVLMEAGHHVASRPGRVGTTGLRAHHQWGRCRGLYIAAVPRRCPLFGEALRLGCAHDWPFKVDQNGHWCAAPKSVPT
jgi:Domain of unknown function (DUF4442)